MSSENSAGPIRIAKNESAPKPAQITAEAEFSLRACIIDREHLEKVWQVACEGFAEDSNFSIETERYYAGISTKITGGTIPEMLEGVRESTSPGDPAVIDNLYLWVSNVVTDLVKERYISIIITPKSVEVLVKGEPEWVNGRSRRIQNLLASKRSKWRWLGRLSRTQLALTRKVSASRSVDKIALGTFIGTILAVLATLLGIWIAHNDATHPHTAGLPSYQQMSSLT